MQLYAITNRAMLPGIEPERRCALIELARIWAKNGIDYIQIREKDLTPSELRALAEQVVTAVRTTNPSTRVLLNGPAQTALECGADGVHLPANSPRQATELARNLFARHARHAIISYSCHSREEVLKAKEESQQGTQAATTKTLILYAPVFQKVTRESKLPGHGLEALRHAVEAAHPIPVFALGGVTPENAPACIAAGADGIAGIRMFLDGGLQCFRSACP
ncbi:MAG TPA: thiamine phosphate synthase [Silvibacterium sp.]|nr:thiamine phosphate synthase [Silvibacterium sp.]